MSYRKILPSILLLVCGYAAVAQYRIDIKVQDAADSLVSLLRYATHERKMLESKRLNSNGSATFEDAAHSLPTGMYVVNTCGKDMPFLVSRDGNFTLSIEYNPHSQNVQDKQDVQDAPLYSKSKENEDFLKYMAYQEKINSIIQKALQNYQRTTSSDLRLEIKTLLDTLQAEQEEFSAIVAGNHPNTLLASIIKASQTPLMPTSQMSDDDSLQWQHEIEYARRNFFRNIDFNDNRLINTPVLRAQLSTFFEQIFAYEPIPDIVDAAQALLTRVAANHEMYRYILTWLYQAYTNSAIEGHSAVGKAMTDIMADSTKADWLTAEQRTEVLANAKRYALNPVGSIAVDLALQTINGTSQSLYMVEAPRTLLYFFNPECNACRVVTPLVYAQYLRYKDKGLQVFAVYTERNSALWERYLRENNFSGFINVWDGNGQANIHDKYGLHNVPQIYVLDENKKILHKGVPIDELQNILFIALLNVEDNF
jgi:hypothetical protein